MPHPEDIEDIFSKEDQMETYPLPRGQKKK
jgi:hypothetical protein